MKYDFIIKDNPQLVRNVLSALRKDRHLSKTFEGSAKSGVLSGFYTNLALLNGMVIGYVRIQGQYDLEKGDLCIRISPANLFFLVLLILLLSIIFLVLASIKHNSNEWIASLFFLALAMGIWIAYGLERKSFIKHLIGVRI